MLFFDYVPYIVTDFATEEYILLFIIMFMDRSHDTTHSLVAGRPFLFLLLLAPSWLMHVLLKRKPGYKKMEYSHISFCP
jgi:hypothetical protein